MPANAAAAEAAAVLPKVRRVKPFMDLFPSCKTERLGKNVLAEWKRGWQAACREMEVRAVVVSHPRDRKIARMGHGSQEWSGLVFFLRLRDGGKRRRERIAPDEVIEPVLVFLHHGALLLGVVDGVAESV